MKTRELLEGGDTDLYLKAIERMFANLGFPDILTVYRYTSKLLKTKLQLRVGTSKVNTLLPIDIRFASMKADVTAATLNPYFVFDYVRRWNGRFPAGEAVIATDPWTSFAYAKMFIGPFPAGELAIATDARLAFKYALEVLKGPFPAGENAIATHPEYHATYTKLFRSKDKHGEGYENASAP